MKVCILQLTMTSAFTYNLDMETIFETIFSLGYGCTKRKVSISGLRVVF